MIVDIYHDESEALLATEIFLIEEPRGGAILTLKVGEDASIVMPFPVEWRIVRSSRNVETDRWKVWVDTRSRN